MFLNPFDVFWDSGVYPRLPGATVNGPIADQPDQVPLGAIEVRDQVFGAFAELADDERATRITVARILTNLSTSADLTLVGDGAPRLFALGFSGDGKVDILRFIKPRCSTPTDGMCFDPDNGIFKVWNTKQF